MYYKDTGFRALYKNFIAFSLKDNLRQCIENYPDADKANCILTYGYIDHNAGLTMEILAAGIKDGDKFKFFDTSTETRAFIRVGAVIEDEFFFFDDKDGGLSKRYSEKLDILKDYAVSEEIEKTRKMAFLDNSRHKYYPDDVMVFLIKQGLNPEGCWVRIIGPGDHYIMGTLLNEPDQNFGYHNGEKIAFFARQQEDKNTILYTDMTPSRKLTAEDLEDGTLLKEAVSIFNKERTEDHFIDVLEFLRDSHVWIPCKADSSDVDMVPDILQKGEQFFFPVFSSTEEMTEYDEHIPKVRKHILEVIPMARNNGKKVAGIVLNAFTEPFVLEAEIFDMVEDMKSRLD